MTIRRIALRIRGEIPVAVWLILAVLFLAEYAWWHSRTRLWDGDALDYVAMALRYAGHSTDEALRLTGVFFHQEATIEGIRGTLTGQKGLPGAAAYNLETPRAVMPLLAVPFIWVFGTKGIWVLLALCAAGFLYVLMRLLTRLFGVTLAFAMVLIYVIASPFWLFQTGIFTEAVAAPIILLVMTRLPLGRVSTRRDLVWIGVLTVVLTFTRQATLVPMGAIAAAWLWTAIRERSRRNEWARPALVSFASGAAAMLTSMVLFPWNELRHFSEVNHLGNQQYASHHIGTILGKMPGIVVDMFAREFRNYLPGEHAVQVMWLLGIIGLILCFRSVYAAMCLGAFVPCVFLTILDATGNTSLRYFVPMYPMLLMLVAELLRRVLASAMPQPVGERTGIPERSSEVAAAVEQPA